MIEMKVWWAKIFYTIEKDTEYYTREDGLFRPDEHKDKYSSYRQKHKDGVIDIIQMRQINHKLKFKEDII